MTDLATRTRDFKAEATRLGFHLVGVTSPEPFKEAEQQLVRWLREGHQAEMAWMTEARARLSCRPDELLPGARALVVVGASYRTVEPDTTIPSSGALPRGRIARYAWGVDYHEAMKARLVELAAFLRAAGAAEGREAHTRVFVDSGPLVERDAAVRAGLGFRGKNTNLLTPIGSFVFLGALLADVDLQFDQPVAKDCGTCRLCVEACPTDALATPYHLAAERCIAYLTIEHKGPIDDTLQPRMGDWIFGCDVCQDVCPYNRSTRGRPRGWPEFEPRPEVGTRPLLSDLLGLDDDTFREQFRDSPVRRTKRPRLQRNAQIALANAALERPVPGAQRSVLEIGAAVD
ncbi:MAG: tRNA epoxyqueuosine(34) reductase QueG [Chloroflexi bacterium]|nr:tRNA epoxyqueuosine(34) reductase QueG [Chloroflexota bacterium]